MTDREILELLVKNFEQVNQRLDAIDARLSAVESDIEDIKTGVHQIQDKICDIEAKNAVSNLELKPKIDKLYTDLIIVEAVSGKNMIDIAFLKGIKQNIA